MSKAQSERNRIRPEEAVAEVLRPPKPPEKLRAERIQELLKGLPGWRLTQRKRALHRVRELPNARAAAAYAAFAAELAGVMDQPVDLSVAGERVTLLLYGWPSGSPKGGGLTETVVELASSLG